jgi:hypothetical protein
MNVDPHGPKKQPTDLGNLGPAQLMPAHVEIRGKVGDMGGTTIHHRRNAISMIWEPLIATRGYGEG